MEASALTAPRLGNFKQMRLMDSVADRKKSLQQKLRQHVRRRLGKTYRERPSATTTMATAKVLGDAAAAS